MLFALFASEFVTDNMYNIGSVLSNFWSINVLYANAFINDSHSHTCITKGFYNKNR
jgi:hypothetical protein